ncbi:hypothetical protein [Helicobacter trogontum]|nr:hypothetical protein [Helicobacter trogontum]
MVAEWKATCGTASASIKCKRPKWKDVKKHTTQSIWQIRMI